MIPRFGVKKNEREAGSLPVHTASGTAQHPQQAKHPHLIIGRHSNPLHSVQPVGGRSWAGRRPEQGPGARDSAAQAGIVLETQGGVKNALGGPGFQNTWAQRRGHLSAPGGGVRGGQSCGRFEGAGFIKWPIGLECGLA